MSSSVKLIIAGPAGVGKTSLVHRFQTGSFSKTSAPTVGVVFASKPVEVCGARLDVRLWDTSGQERYKSVQRSFFMGAMGACVVFDITMRDSFYAVERWVADIREHAGADVVIMLLGNKLDLAERKRAVSVGEALALAERLNLGFMETSALSGTGVELAFSCVLREVYQRHFDHTAAAPRFRRGGATAVAVSSSGSSAAALPAAAPPSATSTMVAPPPAAQSLSRAEAAAARQHRALERRARDASIQLDNRGRGGAAGGTGGGGRRSCCG